MPAFFFSQKIHELIYVFVLQLTFQSSASDMHQHNFKLEQWWLTSPLCTCHHWAVTRETRAEWREECVKYPSAIDQKAYIGHIFSATSRTSVNKRKPHEQGMSLSSKQFLGQFVPINFMALGTQCDEFWAAEQAYCPAWQGIPARVSDHQFQNPTILNPGSAHIIYTCGKNTFINSFNVHIQLYWKFFN